MLNSKKIFAVANFLVMSTAFGRPLIFSHRGASGYRPEHTAAAYELAIEQGADAIEPDLVFSKDGVLVVRHENNISETTDVSTKFPDRKSTKEIDGKSVEGWFTEDFTWQELQTLHARERLTDRDHGFDDQFPILQFSDVIAIVKASKRPIMVIPELKHPSYFRTHGFDPESALVEALDKAQWNSATAPVIVQSFEPTSLERLRKLSEVPAALLIDADGQPFDYATTNDARTYLNLTDPSELKRIRSFAEWIAPHKSLIQSCWFFGIFVSDPTWTLRKETRFVPTCRFGDFESEIQGLEQAGVDAIFTDQPDLAKAASGK